MPGSPQGLAEKTLLPGRAGWLGIIERVCTDVIGPGYRQEHGPTAHPAEGRDNALARSVSSRTETGRWEQTFTRTLDELIGPQCSCSYDTHDSAYRPAAGSGRCVTLEVPVGVAPVKLTPSRRPPASRSAQEGPAVNNTGLEGKDVQYEVVLRFRPGGPAIVGAWSEFETADRKFTQWLGAWGQADAVLTFAAVVDSVVHPMKHWTAEGGVRAGAAGSV